MQLIYTYIIYVYIYYARDSYHKKYELDRHVMLEFYHVTTWKVWYFKKNPRSSKLDLKS